MEQMSRYSSANFFRRLDMAETASRQRSNERSEEKEQLRGGQLETGSRGIERRGSYMPSLFSLTPRDFFTMSPFGMMRRFADEVDRMFSSFASPGTGTTWNQEMTWAPAIEVRESDNNLVVCAELPGLSEKDVKVEATPEGLVIQGERKREYTGEEGGVQRSERSYGRFWRLIPLPEGANVEQAKANFENGVLEVTIPVPEAQQKRRQIPISGGGQETGGQRARSATQGG
jgi:HSP20 family protein